jgi:uncharacterized protein with HEPN domain
MNKELRVPDYLDHILSAIEAIEEYTQNMDESIFSLNRMAQDAVIRNLEVIGEAANNIKKIDSGFIILHEDIPWSQMYKMRNIISHDYFAINMALVWSTVEVDLPKLKQQIMGL